MLMFIFVTMSSAPMFMVMVMSWVMTCLATAPCLKLNRRSYFFGASS